MTYTSLAKFFLGISAVLVAISVVLLFAPGPVLSIEFTGGTLLEVKLPEGRTKAELDTFVKSNPFTANASVSTTRTGTFFIRTANMTNEQHLDFLGAMTVRIGEVQELQFTTIGPTVGRSLKQRAVWALLIASIAIVLYVALAFRKIPRKLNPWKFGMIAVIALLHDVLITVGFFSILSHVTTFQVDTLFVSALLSIMGYSVNDTIVIFDRIRENLQEERNLSDFAKLAERSLLQTLTRTINTGLGALIMLFALFFLGSESIRWFILTLIIGTVIGTYSSFFVATPLLIFWRKKS